VDNGMALHKMIRLITLATAGNGYLNFMGNEFGHPEWIDFPGQHNNWSYHYARRQWSLARNPELKFKFLNEFDRQMIHLFREAKLLMNPSIPSYVQNVPDQVLIFGRGDFIFVFNFSPFRSYTDYQAMVPAGRYGMVLNTDSGEFGGFNRLDEKITFIADTGSGSGSYGKIMLYLPTLTGFVLKKKKK